MSRQAEVAKLVAVAVFWLSIGRLLPELLYRALPEALLNRLSLPAYSMICQVLTTLAGLASARLALANPAQALAAGRPTWWQAVLAALLAPGVFVLASVVALKIAEPYLVAELAREGAGASRRNAGAFGQAVTQAPLLATLAWGAVLAAISEELAFRGALFRAFEQGALALLGRESAPPGRSRAAMLLGVLTVLVTAGVFGGMHADMRGSVGIVRVASATCLGLACGSARLVTGSVLVPMVLHFGYNTISLGLARGLLRGDSDPILSAVPNPLLGLAAVGIFVSMAGVIAHRASRRDA